MRAAALAGAVAVAFADSSIVVLALPDLLEELDAGVQGVSWVITSFNLVVAAGALLLVRPMARLDAARVTRAGVVVFLLASAGCAAAPTLELLIGLRALQGAGAALLLVGSLPLLADLLGDRTRAVAWWAVAGSLGAALGPAAGGLLTEALDWRSIFVAQIPLVAVSLLALPRRAPGDGLRAGRPARAELAADVALGLVSGALVGALFLSVLLLINGWGRSPLAAAIVVSVLPVGTAAAAPLTRRLPLREAVGAGCLLLSAGLVALALLPSQSVGLVLWALALCGLGIGLAVPELVAAGLRGGRPLGPSGAWSIGVRHVGLVVGLVVLTPVLTSGLTSAGDRVYEAGVARLLEAPLGVQEKLTLATDLEERVRTVRARPEEIWEPIRAREARQPALGGLRLELEEILEASLTRGFRAAFLVAAALALLALIPLALTRPRGPA